MNFATLDFSAAADWLCTFALHSTLLLAIALLGSVALRDRAVGFQEGFLRFALWAAFASSSAQCFLLGSALPLSLELPRSAAVPTALADLTDQSRLWALASSASPSPNDVAAPFASLPWPAIVVAAACLFAAMGLGWLWLVYRGLSRVLALRQPEVDPRVLATAAEVAHELGLRQSPHVSRCDLIAVPIAFGLMRPEICLPERASALGDASLRAMLAHEIAHLRRGDPAWMWLAAWLQALFPWQVLLLLVRRRWARLVELRCDATAARHSSPTAVARCLLDVAEWLRPDASMPLVALGMAARPSSLRERVEAVLHGQPSTAPRPLAFGAFGCLSLSALTLVAPGVQTATVRDGAQGAAPAAVALGFEGPDAPDASDASAASSAAADSTRALAATMQLLQVEHANLEAEVARLHSDLQGRAQSPLIGQMLSALQRRLLSLERLRARLQARLDRRTTEPR